VQNVNVLAVITEVDYHAIFEYNYKYDQVIEEFQEFHEIESWQNFRCLDELDLSKHSEKA